MSTIFPSSKKSFSTFHKVLKDKRIIIPARYFEHASSSFIRSISSDKESNVLSIPSTLEIKFSCIPHVFPSKNDDILPSSEASRLSSLPQPTSSFQSAFESKFAYLKTSIFNSSSMIIRHINSKSRTKTQIKTSQEHMSSSSSQFLPALKESSSSLISTTKVYHLHTHSSSSKFVIHPKEDRPPALSPHINSLPTLNTGFNQLSYS